MRTLLVLAPAHWRGGSTHWPATSWVRMQWAGSQARDMAPHQWSCTSATLQGTGWHMLGASAKELQQGNVHTALPELPNCLCTAVCNLYAMQIQKVWSSTQAHTTCH